MSRVLAAAAGSVVLLLVLAGCSNEPDAAQRSEPQAVEAGVDVDTPRLRALKSDAGVERCEPGQPGDAEAGGHTPDRMPDVVLPCLGGGPDVDLSSLRGPMVVNLWAQWCGPCRGELPYYQRLHERAGDRVRVLGIDYQDTQPQQALELVRDTGVTYPLLADPAAATRAPFRVRGLPGLLFVDEHGSVVHQEYTVIRSEHQLRELVETYLGVRL